MSIELATASFSRKEKWALESVRYEVFGKSFLHLCTLISSFVKTVLCSYISVTIERVH